LGSYSHGAISGSVVSGPDFPHPKVQIAVSNIAMRAARQLRPRQLL
jgi:hypothetical protein